MRILATAVLIAAASLAAGAQVAQPAQPIPDRRPATSGTAPTSMVPLGPEMRSMLSQLERTGEQISMHVGELPVKKWKTDSGSKDQVQHDISSVQSNISATLPSLISQVRSSPDNTAVLFKLYRNVDALLEVMRGLAESAGAFGSKSDFDTLQSDSQNLAAVRSSLASQIDVVATNNHTALTNMRAQLAQAQAAAAAAPPKKIVVDDDEPAKKTTKKKKPAASTQPKEQPPKS
jgi:hypothetical protein